MPNALAYGVVTALFVDVLLMMLVLNPLNGPRRKKNALDPLEGVELEAPACQKLRCLDWQISIAECIRAYTLQNACPATPAPRRQILGHR